MKNLEKHWFYYGICLVAFVFWTCKEKSTEKEPKVDKVLVGLNDSLQKFPTQAELYYKRAQYYFDHKAYDEAEFDITKALNLDSTKPKYYFLLGDTYMNYFQSRLALLTIQKAVGKFPQDIPTLLKLTEYEYTLTKYDDAMQTIKTIIDLDPQNAKAFLMMGLVLKENKDTKRALLAFKKSTELDPYLVDSWVSAGIIYDEQKDPKALDYYKAALRIDSLNYSALYAEAMHYQRVFDRKSAIDHYLKITQVYPSQPEPYFNIGVMYYEMDSLDQAMKYFNKATDIDLIYAEAYYAQGLVFEKQGKRDSAFKAFSRASSSKPSFRKAAEALERNRPAK